MLALAGLCSCPRCPHPKSRTRLATRGYRAVVLPSRRVVGRPWAHHQRRGDAPPTPCRRRATGLLARRRQPRPPGPTRRRTPRRRLALLLPLGRRRAITLRTRRLPSPIRTARPPRRYQDRKPEQHRSRSPPRGLPRRNPQRNPWQSKPLPVRGFQTTSLRPRPIRLRGSRPYRRTRRWACPLRSQRRMRTPLRSPSHFRAARSSCWGYLWPPPSWSRAR